MTLPVFTNIANSAIDPNSPITTELMTAYRDNDEHLEEWLGKDYTAAPNHDHNGVNSKLVTQGGLFGDGDDGDVTISTATTIDGVKNYNSLTIDDGATLYLEYHGLIKVLTDLDLNTTGRIVCTAPGTKGLKAGASGPGGDGSSDTGTTTLGATYADTLYAEGGEGGNTPAGDPDAHGSGGAGGSGIIGNGGNGGQAGNEGDATGGESKYDVAGSVDFGYESLMHPVWKNGIAGGGGGTGEGIDTGIDSVDGGDGGGCLTVAVGGDLIGDGEIECNGVDGENGSITGVDSGGGGGGGGGALAVLVDGTIDDSPTISADGGDGGNGSGNDDAGGGGGGGGGFVLVATTTAHTATVTAAAGSGGTAVGAGDAGHNGDAGMTLDEGRDPRYYMGL
jgi:hypothetical protein